MADLNFAGSYDGLHLPYSPEAEQAVLGAIILESDTFDKVVDTLKSPDYFYVSLHKLIFVTDAGDDWTRSEHRLCYTA